MVIKEHQFHSFRFSLNGKILDWSRLTACAVHKINVTQRLKFVLRKVESFFAKGKKRLVTTIVSSMFKSFLPQSS